MDTERDPTESHYTPNMLKGATAEHLNTMLPAARGWQRVQARKHHEDLFGQTVNPGEHYFERLSGPGFGQKLKLSSDSMNRLLVAVFFESGDLRTKADATVAWFKDHMLAEMRRAQELAAAHARKPRGDAAGTKDD